MYIPKDSEILGKAKSAITLNTMDLNTIDPNINDQNSEGDTALNIAVKLKDNLNVVESLLKKEASSNIKNCEGDTAFIKAVYDNDIMTLLLPKKVNLDIQNRKGDTVLMKALEEIGAGKVVISLLKKRANPNIQNHDGDTVLIKAVYNNNDDDTMIYILLLSKADPNIQNRKSKTPLMLAVEFGLFNLVKILLERGADPNIKTEDGKTALLILYQNMKDDCSNKIYIDMFILLLKYGANLHAVYEFNNDIKINILAKGEDLNIETLDQILTNKDFDIINDDWDEQDKIFYLNYLLGKFDKLINHELYNLSHYEQLYNKYRGNTIYETMKYLHACKDTLEYCKLNEYVIIKILQSL